MPQTIYIKDYDTEVEIPDNADMQQVQDALAKQFPDKSQQPQSPIVEQTSQPSGINERLKSAARVAAPYARPILETGGAFGGGLIAGGGTMGLGTLAGAGLGYAAGRQGADMLEQYAGLQQPKELGRQLLETGTDVMAGAAMEASGGIAGKAIGGALKYVGNIAPRLYESIAKIPPSSVPKQVRDKIIKTALEEKIPATQKGLSKLQGMIDTTNDKIAKIIDDAASLSKRAKTLNSKSGVNEYDEDTIAIKDILKRLDSVKDWAKKSYADPTPIYKMIDEYKTGVSSSRGSEIAVDEAQKLKQGIYRRLSDSAYGEYSTPQKEIDKQFARGIKEELFAKYPQLQELNSKDSALINLNNALEKTVNRTRNRDIMGLSEYGGTITGAELAGGPGAAIGAIATKIFRSPAVLSQLSFALNKANKKIGTPILQRTIGYPIGQSSAPSPDQAEQAIGGVLGSMATPAQAMGNVPGNARSPLDPKATPTPSKMVPEGELSLQLYRDAQKSYLNGDYNTALTYFKQLLREDPKRSIIYKKAIDQINSEKENSKNYNITKTEEPKNVNQVTEKKNIDMRDIAKKISPYARPALEIGGTVGGALLASPGNVVAPGLASAAGGGLGFAAGRQLANKLDEYAGLRKQKSLGEELKGASQDFAFGSISELGGAVAGMSISKLSKLVGELAPEVFETLTNKSIYKLTEQQKIKAIETALKLKQLSRKDLTEMIKNKVKENLNKKGMIKETNFSDFKNSNNQIKEAGRPYEVWLPQ